MASIRKQPSTRCPRVRGRNYCRSTRPEGLFLRARPPAGRIPFGPLPDDAPGAESRQITMRSLVDRHRVRRIGRRASSSSATRVPAICCAWSMVRPVRQIRRDPRRPERVAARRGREARGGRPPRDHGEHPPPRPRQRPPTQPLPRPGVAPASRDRGLPRRPPPSAGPAL